MGRSRPDAELDEATRHSIWGSADSQIELAMEHDAEDEWRHLTPSPPEEIKGAHLPSPPPHHCACASWSRMKSVDSSRRARLLIPIAPRPRGTGEAAKSSGRTHAGAALIGPMRIRRGDGGVYGPGPMRIGILAGGGVDGGIGASCGVGRRATVRPCRLAFKSLSVSVD
jgi:hypothetical protein